MGPAGFSEAARHSSFLHPIPSRHVVIIRITIVIIENYKRCVCNQMKTPPQVLLVLFKTVLQCLLMQLGLGILLSFCAAISITISLVALLRVLCRYVVRHFTSHVVRLWISQPQQPQGYLAKNSSDNMNKGEQHTARLNPIFIGKFRYAVDSVCKGPSL